MDPYQREIFVQHQVVSGRYAEIFTSYYAHTQDTAVRRGDAVSAGTVLGRVGTTGSSFGEHLHLSVHRHRNLSYRSAFEFRFEGGQHDRDASVSAIDPWGWMAPQGVDPWAWRFRDHASDPLRDNAGGFSSRLWIPGEAPPLN
jgi:murein DD-endopeptidase MepM/ murein hydrolase activator NlpD